MSEKSIQRVIKETVFTMWAEGFVLTDEEKSTLHKVLSGKMPFASALETYIKNAKATEAVASA